MAVTHCPITTVNHVLQKPCPTEDALSDLSGVTFAAKSNPASNSKDIKDIFHLKKDKVLLFIYCMCFTYKYIYLT